MNFALTRKLIVFGLVLPLAAIIGFSLATPQESKTFLILAMVIGLLLLPIFLRWYHPILIFGWNAFVNIFFLPGKPQLWMLLSVIGLGIAVLNRTLDREKTFINVPALTAPLIAFLAVVLITAKLTGGLGVRALGGGAIGGGAIGGKGYYMIMFAVMGYFALTSKIIPIERAKLYISWFFLSGVTGVLSNVAFVLGPAFYFLYYLFPVEFALDQAAANWDPGIQMKRLGGVAAAGMAGYFFMMARFGIRGILDITKPWRLAAFLLIVFVSLFGGYRNLLIGYIIHFAAQFCLEGLVRTRLCLFLVMGGIIAGTAMVPFVEKMPMSVQRCLAFVPGLEVNAAAKASAEESTRWRLEMWKVLVPEIPKYLILGKGYALNPAELYLANQAVQRGIARAYDVSIVSGAYHNGPLSVIIPFGMLGSLAFLWFIGAGFWVLYRNYRYGDPAMRVINTFMLAYFFSRIAIFFVVFGGIEGDLYRFLGVLGVSVALNRGVRKAVPSMESLAPVPVPQPA